MFKKNPADFFQLQIKQARHELDNSNFEVASQILDGFPNSKRKGGWISLKAECYLAQKKWNQAIHFLESINPLRSVEQQNLLYHAYLNARQYEKAILYCRKHHETLILDKRQAVSFAKLARMANNPHLTLESLEFIVKKFPNYADLTMHLAEHYLSVDHPLTFSLLIRLISTTPYHLKYQILYVKWAIQHQQYALAHFSLIQILYSNPMFLSASIELIRLFAELNNKLIADLTLRQTLFRHRFSNNAVQKTLVLQSKFPFLKNLEPINCKVSLYPEISYFFDLLNADKHQCYLVGSVIHHLLDIKPLKDTQDIDFVIDFNPRIYYPFHQSYENSNLFTADIRDINHVIRNVDCFYMDSRSHSSLKELVQNRDFTINALLCDHQGNIYDPTNMGIKDYQYKILRTIQAPRFSLEQDPLRILRVLKYLQQGYTPTDELQCAIMNWQPYLGINMPQMVAMARKIYLLADNKDNFIQLLQMFGLHSKIFGIEYETESEQIKSELEGMFFSSGQSFRR